jgi:type IV pilus assembly protein PilE
MIELLIIVVIAAVLAGIAYPAFVSQLNKARRSDAVAALVRIEAAQARFRSNGSRYGSLREIGVAESSAAGHYSLKSEGHTADGYVVIATATGAQAGDASCRFLKLDVVRATASYRSGPDASTANPDLENRRCWSL